MKYLFPDVRNYTATVESMNEIIKEISDILEAETGLTPLTRTDYKNDTERLIRVSFTRPFLESRNDEIPYFLELNVELKNSGEYPEKYLSMFYYFTEPYHFDQ